MIFFDSLTHPTLTGTLNNRSVTFNDVKDEMLVNGFKWACAVGLSGTEGYNHDDFIKECSKHDCFIPIAGFDPKKKVNELEKELNYLSKIGFKGIKIHPRISGVSWNYETLSSILNMSSGLNLVVMLCTYSNSDVSMSESLNSLILLLNGCSNTKVILLHGGNVKLLEYAEFVKSNPNLLLDLSFTIMKYKGSSLDLDLRYLFKNFDRRICIGTDHPWYAHKELSERFDELSKDLDVEKKENIAYRNLKTLFNL